jgi:hypothetical protein
MNLSRRSLFIFIFISIVIIVNPIINANFINANHYFSKNKILLDSQFISVDNSKLTIHYIKEQKQFLKNFSRFYSFSKPELLVNISEIKEESEEQVMLVKLSSKFFLSLRILLFLFE